jgi:hypothetical protein
MATTTHKTAPRTRLTRVGRPPQARAEIDRRMAINELPAYMTRDEVAALKGALIQFLGCHEGGAG